MHVYTREGISRRCDCGHARFEQVVEMYRCVRGGRDARGFQMCWYMEPTSAERLGVGRRQSVAAPPPAPAITPPAPNLLLSSTFLLLVLPPFSLCFFSFLLFFEREREKGRFLQFVQFVSILSSQILNVWNIFFFFIDCLSLKILARSIF